MPLSEPVGTLSCIHPPEFQVLVLPNLNVRALAHARSVCRALLKEVVTDAEIDRRLSATDSDPDRQLSFDVNGRDNKLFVLYRLLRDGGEWSGWGELLRVLHGTGEVELPLVFGDEDVSRPEIRGLFAEARGDHAGLERAQQELLRRKINALNTNSNRDRNLWFYIGFFCIGRDRRHCQHSRCGAIDIYRRDAGHADLGMAMRCHLLSHFGRPLVELEGRNYAWAFGTRGDFWLIRLYATPTRTYVELINVLSPERWPSSPLSFGDPAVPCIESPNVADRLQRAMPHLSGPQLPPCVVRLYGWAETYVREHAAAHIDMGRTFLRFWARRKTELQQGEGGA
ncbi:unnamed protein product [Vitrella brassicaformis CCMP3155]|uniref:Uncharacterized protein n=1 Tax=Vitrella brassicaformis (strain CCMP3155) TaxID=1169540 RepID=A0A0G4EUI1_VITBC|nr:unnamed protein product [Vitrella brassicaformis CCMP3155]|eukprot:CEM01746.1 unnamed protein product [Vitrella brassicaformis CCMP3155]